jgi:acyl-coenzyme A synthetase/AMP-(fatty) acid ligase
MATFQGDWTRTGDKCFVDPQGYFHFCGRSDDLLKVDGMWVSPFEVEACLMAHEQVVEAAVVGVRDGDALVNPRAFVVLRHDALATHELEADLKKWVREHLMPHKCPRWIQFTKALPKTATGKIQRFKLR